MHFSTPEIVQAEAVKGLRPKGSIELTRNFCQEVMRVTLYDPQHAQHAETV